MMPFRELEVFDVEEEMCVDVAGYESGKVVDRGCAKDFALILRVL